MSIRRLCRQCGLIISGLILRLETYRSCKSASLWNSKSRLVSLLCRNGKNGIEIKSDFYNPRLDFRLFLAMSTIFSS